MTKKHLHPADFANDDAPYVVELENTLRKLIGNADVDAFFSPAKIQACQVIVEKAKADFYDEVCAIFAAMESTLAKISKHPDRAGREAQRMAHMGAEMQGRMEDIGMSLGPQVAQSLRHCLHYPVGDQRSLMVIGKHMEVLAVVIRRKIMGDEGALGREMLDILSKLTRKTHS